MTQRKSVESVVAGEKIADCDASIYTVEKVVVRDTDVGMTLRAHSGRTLWRVRAKGHAVHVLSA